MGLAELLVALAATAVGSAVGWLLNNRFGRRSLESTRQRADQLLRAARRDAEEQTRAIQLEARQEILEQRNKADRDLRSRRGQLQKQERDIKAALAALDEREAALVRREEALVLAESGIVERQQAVEQTRLEADGLVEQQNELLERVGGMTRDEARRQLVTNLKAQARYEAAIAVREIRDEAQRSADAEAKKILALAIERAASEFTTERTVNQFKLPEGTEIRGRIIGQEGKNIRAFESATGIQLLLDEEAGTATLSGYNPVRREIARRVLDALIKDGNVHPRRIEELTRRNERRLDDEMRRAGQETLRELGIRGVHPEMVKLLGRLRHRTSYGQNVLLHSTEVAYLTGMMAAELRLDEKLARRAGLMHDIGKAIDYEREGTHPEIGAEVAQKYGEPEVVINAIASHHEDCDATSPISVLVAAADAISGSRPGARRQSAAEYIKRIEKLEELAASFAGVEQCYALQAGREIRIIAQARQLDDERVVALAEGLTQRIESELDYPGKIKVTVIREFRAVETAH